MENSINTLLEKDFQGILKRYNTPRSAILPMLQFVQKKYGYISKENVETVADVLGLSSTEIGSVLSFYGMFNTSPSAQYMIYVCSNVSCGLHGAEKIITFLENRLNIKEGQITVDGKFALRTVECLGACGGAPVVQINNTYYENMTNEKMEKIISEMEKQ
ncbi:MAG: NAD(P)H-dependent oxidoreductase subunit E [Candidatus Omnitrophica bacterium]|nr:NAD(P)H-dependent oxidoreductase subunit E [Candidatus Omnitrophota bacterium]